MKDTNEIKAFRSISFAMDRLDDGEKARVRGWFSEKYARVNFLAVLAEECESLQKENEKLSKMVKKQKSPDKEA